MKAIKITNEAPERLDKVFVELFEVSRAKIQKAIKQGLILVDGEKVTPKFPVSKNNKIEMEEDAFLTKKSVYEAPKLDVLYEDDDVVVVNKPAGLLVHATESSDEPTLVDGLIAHDPKIADVGDKDRSGIVHRLDKFASGIIIAAKTEEAFEHLKDQFKMRRVAKKYTVLVHGTMELKTGTITLPISRAKGKGRMAAKPTSQGGRDAITHYDVVEQFPHHALLDVSIETGRTHQIRAHFFAIEHPVAGDTLYHQKLMKVMELGRLFLHARELTIELPSGETKTFTAPLPPDLEKILSEIPKI